MGESLAPREGSHRAHATAARCGLIAACLGLLGLALSTFGGGAFQALGAGGGAMLPGGALCFLVCGLSLRLAHASSPIARRWSRLTALALVVLAVSAVLALSFPALLEVAPASFSEAVAITPGAALSFLSLGLAILFAARVALSQSFAGLTLVFAIVSFFGQLHDAEAIYGVFGATLPLLTVVGLAIAAAGALFLRPDGGLARILLTPGESGRQSRLLVLAAFALPIGVGLVAATGSHLRLWAVEQEGAIVSIAMMVLLLGFAVYAWWSAERVEAGRLAALASLAASEERYRRTFRNATVGIANLSPDGRWIAVNERVCEILGYEEPELLGMTYQEVSDLADLAVDVRQWELLRRGEIADYGVERRFRTKGGEIVFAEVRLVRQEDAGGQLQQFILVMHDVTGRKLSQGTLQLYERALQGTQNGIVICDATREDYPIIYVNPAFLDVSGYESADLIGRNCRVLNRHARDQAALEVLRVAIARGEECSVLLRNHRKDGTAFWNQLSIAPVHDEEGRLTHFVGIAIDATERVETAAEREQLLHRAEDANRAKDRFLSVVSHELRSPINAVLAWASILREDAPSDDVLRAVEAIEASVRSQSRLVDDLLEVSRIRAGSLEVEPADIDLGAQIDDVVSQLLPLASDRRVALHWERPSAPVRAHADPERVSQIVRNLIDNAFKFTPEGGRVEVVLAAAAHDATIEIRDDGQGIPADSLGSVFEEFWQDDRHDAKSRKGLGLGLAIVKHLVERQDGTITAESAGIGQGATFRIRLPRVVVEAGEADAAPEAEPPTVVEGSAASAPRAGSHAAAAHPASDARAGPADGARSPAPRDPGPSDSPRGSGERTKAAGSSALARPHRDAAADDAARLDVDLAGVEIVIVDDHEPTVHALATLVERRGAVVRTGHSVAEVLRYFETGEPDILISDIGLPDRDGMDLIRTIRSGPAPNRSVLALAVTGFADEGERRRIQRAGFDAYLSKPIAPDVVLERAARLWALESAEVLPSRRVLVVEERAAPAVAEDLYERLAAAGHEVQRAGGTTGALEAARALEPEIVFVVADPPPAERAERGGDGGDERDEAGDASGSGDSPGDASPGSIADRLRSVLTSTLLVAVLDRDDQAGVDAFDFVLRLPIEDHALRRIVAIEEDGR